MDQEYYTEAMINAETAFANGNHALALEWFRKAISVNEKSLTAIAKAGAACVSLSKFDEALSYFKKIYEMQPDSGDNAFNVGTVYFFQGNYAKALELYSEAEMKGCSSETKPKLYYQLSMLCSIRNDVPAALANLEKYEYFEKSETAALNPDIISEKVKLYLKARDYSNAAKYAVQWIALAPKDTTCYMVYFSILMAQKDYVRAENVLDDAEKFSDHNEAVEVKMQLERVSLLAAMSDNNTEASLEYLNKAYNILAELLEKAPESDKPNIRLTFAEVCIKMKKYDEAIQLVSSLVPKDKVEEINLEFEEDDYYELNDYAVDEMIDEDMGIIDEMITVGELSEDEGDYAEIYYDDYGNPIREYPEGTFDYLIEAYSLENNEEEEDTEKKTVEPKELSTEFYDRVYFILLSCYTSTEDYTNAYKFGNLLKHSENEYYSYLARYTIAFSMKKLCKANGKFSIDAVDKIYAETLAFYRSEMMKNPKGNYAVIFRARMYAETSKFVKAEEIARLLPGDEKNAVLDYINQCRQELAE